MKVGNCWNDESEGWYWDFLKVYIKEVVKKSFVWLKMDYIDFYQFYGGMIEDNIDEMIEVFEELK